MYSCTDNNNDEPIGAKSVFNYFIHYQDSKGNDLLSPEVANSYKHSEVSFYFFDKGGNGKKVVYNNIIKKLDSKYFLELDSNFRAEQLRSSLYRFYLKLSEKETDIIDVEVFGLGVARIWYNNKQVWDKSKAKQKPGVIKIVKDK